MEVNKALGRVEYVEGVFPRSDGSAVILTGLGEPRFGTPGLVLVDGTGTVLSVTRLPGIEYVSGLPLGQQPKSEDSRED
jgi:hypothetical protein